MLGGNLGSLLYGDVSVMIPTDTASLIHVIKAVKAEPHLSDLHVHCISRYSSC